MNGKIKIYFGTFEFHIDKNANPSYCEVGRVDHISEVNDTPEDIEDLLDANFDSYDSYLIPAKYSGIIKDPRKLLN